jgi:hypothetical protein
MDILSKYQYLKSLANRTDKIPWQDRDFTPEERPDFLKAVEECDKRHPLFLWMKKSRTTMLIWVTSVFIFGGFSLIHALFNRTCLLSIVVAFLLGVFPNYLWPHSRARPRSISGTRNSQTWQ